MAFGVAEITSSAAISAVVAAAIATCTGASAVTAVANILGGLACMADALSLVGRSLIVLFLLDMQLLSTLVG